MPARRGQELQLHDLGNVRILACADADMMQQ